MQVEIIMIDGDAEDVAYARYLLERRCRALSIAHVADADQAEPALRRRLLEPQRPRRIVTFDPATTGLASSAAATRLRPLCARLGAALGVLTKGAEATAAAWEAGFAFYALKPFTAPALSALGARIGAFRLTEERAGLRLDRPIE